MSDTTALAEAISDLELRHTRFYNGRLLTGQDLEAEQKALHAHLRHLGTAVGPGVANGMEVSPLKSTLPADPVLTITAGLALNRRGQTLRLASDLRLRLSPPDLAKRSACLFGDCDEQGSGSVVPTETGFFVLTIGPASVLSDERSPVSGTGIEAVTCDVRDVIEAVRIRLFHITIPAIDVGHLRNAVALAGLGLTPDWPATLPVAYGLETLVPGGLPATEVPLAVVEWTAKGLGLLKMWPVRRRITRPSAAGSWDYLTGDRRVSEGEAFFMDFQDDLNLLAAPTGALATLKAHDHFTLLPAAGVLLPGLDWKTFLGDLAPPAVTPTDLALLPARLRESFVEEPIPVLDPKIANPPVRPALKVFEAPAREERLFARSHLGRVRLLADGTPPDFDFAILQLPDASFRVLHIAGNWPLVFEDVPGGEANLWLSKLDLKTLSQYAIKLQNLESDLRAAKERAMEQSKETEEALTRSRKDVDLVLSAVPGPRLVESLESEQVAPLENLRNAGKEIGRASTAFQATKDAWMAVENLEEELAKLKLHGKAEFLKKRFLLGHPGRVSPEDVARLIAVFHFQPVAPVHVVNGRVTDIFAPERTVYAEPRQEDH